MRRELLSLIDVLCCAEREVATLPYDLTSITAVNSLRHIFCSSVYLSAFQEFLLSNIRCRSIPNIKIS